MVTIFLSPHFDDAVLSCGGLIWEMAQRGDHVEIWTICAGLPVHTELSAYAQEMHERWGLTVEEAVQARKAEDQVALARLGVGGRYFNLPDAIYRRHPKTGEFLYTSDAELFGAIQPGDQEHLRRLASELAKSLEPGDVTLVSPLTVGNHVDHVLVRVAASMLPVKTSYYPDYPYVRQYSGVLDRMAPTSHFPVQHPISEEGLLAWQDSIAAYLSQLSTFWDSEQEMREEVSLHRDRFQGVTLWEMKGQTFPG